MGNQIRRRMGLLVRLTAHLLVTLAFCPPRRRWRGRGRISRGQAPIAHHEAVESPEPESDRVGSADSGIFYAVGLAHTLRQDSRSPEDLDSHAASPSFGEAKVSASIRC